MCVTRSRGSIKLSTSPMPTVLWRSRTSRKLQTTTTSTSRKRRGTTWAFILKRIKERLPPKALRRANAECRAKKPPVRGSADRRSNGKSEVISQPTKIKPEEEAEYDGHKRSNRSV